jgi:hypothetical protein
MMRRIAGLALAAVMLHLNAQRVNVFCARHTAITPAHAGQHGADHHHSAEAPVAPEEPQHTSSPSRPDCCDQLATCAMMLGLRTDQPTVRITVSHAEPLSVAQSEPPSWDTSPRAPPPKA